MRNRASVARFSPSKGLLEWGACEVAGARQAIRSVAANPVRGVRRPARTMAANGYPFTEGQPPLTTSSRFKRARIDPANGSRA